MKHLLGYSVWNKVDMIAWLLEGLANNFSPANTEIAFHFDTCVDGSIESFDCCVQYWLLNRGWKPEQIHKLVSTTETREVGGHNKLMELFMRTSCDFLIVAQDDQRWNTGTVLADLERLAGHYGERLGLVGGRDGYTANYGNFTGSQWSESAVQRRLGYGEWVELPYQNSGPNVYTRPLVEKVGMLDDQFRAYYVWDDYGARAIKAGFVNGILGMNVTHAKFGRVRATQWVDYSGQDRARLTTKHGI